MKITANKFVAVTYDLNVGEGEERELMEKAVAEAPLKFIFGTGAMLPAFEDALKGLEVGDKFDFSIAPADAYGEYVEDHVLDLPKNIFEVEGKFDSEIIKEGNGKKPGATDRVKCHYEGTLIDGTLFDSSIKRGEPAVFGVNQVIKGWVEALQLMTEGSKWRLFIPSELAYGAQQAGEMIPPHSTLIFDVELIEVL